MLLDVRKERVGAGTVVNKVKWPGSWDRDLWGSYGPRADYRVLIVCLICGFAEAWVEWDELLSWRSGPCPELKPYNSLLVITYTFWTDCMLEWPSTWGRMCQASL